MYHVYGRGWLEVEGVVVVICVVVRDKGCEVETLVYVEYGDGWNSGWGKIWSLHAFLMVCCHTELSMQMAEVSCVWYCVTFVVGGGNDVMMACWKD